MIRALIDFALRNRLMILGASLVLFAWGIFSFHALPIEAYPDVADTYAQVITQWPGHAAEEVEQQITVPLEVELNGVDHLTHLRSVSLMGLSIITIIYDDNITTFNARQEVLDRLQLVTLPPGVNPGIGPDYSPTGQIMFYSLTSTNPKYDVMELKSLNDWVVVNQLKSVPNIVDVNPFGGPTREYQVQLDPGKLVAYGLSLSQVENALVANNINAGGGFIERGEQALNVRAVGLMQAAFEAGLAYARERKVFGRAVFDYELSKVKLARMAAAAGPLTVTRSGRPESGLATVRSGQNCRALTSRNSSRPCTPSSRP